MYRHEDRSTILSSDEGIHQGDPLGPFLFSVAIQDSLTELQKKHSEVIFLAYPDDVFILGQSDAILHALADLREALSSIGLVICDRKSEIYWPSKKGDQVLAENVNILIRADGIVVLGVPIGNRDYVSNTCSEFTERGKQLQLEDIQSAMLLLRYSHSHRLGHLLRTIPPDILWPAAFTHDLQTRFIFSRLLNVDAISDSAWEQAVLPVRPEWRVWSNIGMQYVTTRILGWLGSVSAYSTQPVLRAGASGRFCAQGKYVVISHSGHHQLQLATVTKSRAGDDRPTI